ncbi:sigma-70 family RNA polymerase sigma factor [Inhella gelatinilytica]|uniref:Sigma-70 family RNA polymerase sigma factor n=1 Tax=Inhella gelatinilytica TaxID=2795030 RepID=A0A931NEA2_9BURK|nr:sigma-70 family RNA polymerase sigma factor [Inhella gelatinilytica]MBH9553040.1 sigma-70 family RNA polymerase sigma factor [Inhella gelatinilytica]
MSVQATSVSEHPALATWHGPLLRFARLHLSPLEEAEDAVQETFLAAVSAESPEHAANPRAYLFGILKHKITDRLRRRYKAGAEVLPDDPDELDALLFDGRGHWLPGVAVNRWADPVASLESDQFFQVVDACVSRLPLKVARVFSMKELLECDASEVCSTLGMTQADYWQCMSRARKQLQLCLSQRWFDGRSS